MGYLLLALLARTSVLLNNIAAVLGQRKQVRRTRALEHLGYVHGRMFVTGGDALRRGSSVYPCVCVCVAGTAYTAGSQ